MKPIKIAEYLAHSKTESFKKAVLKSMRLIEAHPNYPVMISWGKDSLCCLDMAYEVFGADLAAYHIHYDSKYENYPDIKLVRETYLGDKSIKYNEILMPHTIASIYETVGRFFITPESTEEKTLVARRKVLSRELVDQTLDNAGYKGKIVGVCAHESRVRALNISLRGIHYETKIEMKKLLPIAHWTVKDVWGYMISKGLPRLRIYDVSDNPETARSEIVFGSVPAAADAMRRHGVYSEIRRAYPELMKTIEGKFPEVRSFR